MTGKAEWLEVSAVLVCLISSRCQCVLVIITIAIITFIVVSDCHNTMRMTVHTVQEDGSTEMLLAFDRVGQLSSGARCVMLHVHTLLWAHPWPRMYDR